ncbi:hypothetical protein FB451DRAFT_1054053 [Mycena latifolia]|nr:hypothetical protein FB451DRAFT_1054053 [Mycena latifolia]
MLLDINHKRLNLDRDIAFDCNGALIKFKLRGVIYGGQGHFTCRYLDQAGGVWFHDGISTGRICIREGDLATIDTMTLHVCGRKDALAVIYARE